MELVVEGEGEVSASPFWEWEEEGKRRRSHRNGRAAGGTPPRRMVERRAALWWWRSVVVRVTVVLKVLKGCLCFKRCV